jgi:isopropylmalate/homocitrate/citramalate synthase
MGSMRHTKLDFNKEEETRRRYMEVIKKLSSPIFDLERWEKLKKIVYKPRSIDLDVIVDDTTLREGLQMAELTSPSPRDMCHIACLLRDIGVERIEVITFTKSDREALNLIKNEGLGKMLAGWCRATREDVDIALKLDLPEVGVSHPVSYIHFEKWPDKPLDQLVERIVDTVQYATDHGLKVFVHGEDSTRADWEFEKKLINATAEAGAKVYRICDTVGCGSSDPSAPLPNGIPQKIKRIKEETVIPYVEIHAHDDLGNAVENTMASIRAAAGLYDKIYVSTTFLGIGDRAGNAETEKVIMNCYMLYDIHKWNLKYLRETANFLASSLNYHLPLNKAIVGDGAFMHESGIHVQGVISLPLTYEVFPPELVGHERRIKIGKRSGKHAIKLKAEEILGEKIDDKDPRLELITKLIQEEYDEGEKRYPLTANDFKQLLVKAGFKKQ